MLTDIKYFLLSPYLSITKVDEIGVAIFVVIGLLTVLFGSIYLGYRMDRGASENKKTWLRRHQAILLMTSAAYFLSAAIFNIDYEFTRNVGADFFGVVGIICFIWGGALPGYWIERAWVNRQLLKQIKTEELKAEEVQQMELKIGNSIGAIVSGVIALILAIVIRGL